MLGDLNYINRKQTSCLIQIYKKFGVAKKFEKLNLLGPRAENIDMRN